REYAAPDGKLAAREKVVYEGDTLIAFELEELQTGASGSARLVPGDKKSDKPRIVFEYREHADAHQKPKTANERWQNDTIVNDMLAPFLVDHFEQLSRGDKVRCRYIVIARRETVGFTFSKVESVERQGRSLLLIKMEASSPLIAALMDPICFFIETQPPHHIVEYVGRTTPKINVN